MTPGYLHRPGLTAAAFDDAGFYRTGDAVGLVDPDDPGQGRLERVLLLAEPPQLDAGEITDKGYINQRKVVERRAAFIDRLYADDPEDVVIVVGG